MYGKSPMSGHGLGLSKHGLVQDITRCDVLSLSLLFFSDVLPRLKPLL
jgi:hypothetical protein